MIELSKARENVRKAEQRMTNANRAYRANPNNNNANAEITNALNALQRARVTLYNAEKREKAKKMKRTSNLKNAENALNRARLRMINANRAARANPNNNNANAEVLNAMNALFTAREKLNKVKANIKAGKPEAMALITKFFKTKHPKKRATEANKIRFWVAEVSKADKAKFIASVRNPGEFKKVYPMCAN